MTLDTTTWILCIAFFESKPAYRVIQTSVSQTCLGQQGHVAGKQSAKYKWAVEWVIGQGCVAVAPAADNPQWLSWLRPRLSNETFVSKLWPSSRLWETGAMLMGRPGHDNPARPWGREKALDGVVVVMCFIVVYSRRSPSSGKSPARKMRRS